MAPSLCLDNNVQWLTPRLQRGQIALQEILKYTVAKKHIRTNSPCWVLSMTLSDIQINFPILFLLLFVFAQYGIESFVSSTVVTAFPNIANRHHREICVMYYYKGKSFFKKDFRKCRINCIVLLTLIFRSALIVYSY